MNALLLIDIQNDFVPGGALPVPDGDKIVPIVNDLQEKFDLVVATQDWHPARHGSFAAMHPGKRPGEVIELNGLPQVLWPVHCVEETAGAAFVPDLHQGRIAEIFRKGTDPGIDSYSGFFDNGHRKATGLADYLKSRGVTDLYVCGLATDYCVKFTALDARQIGFNVTLIEDATRGVNLRLTDCDEAIEEMKRAGVKVVASRELL